MNKARRALHSVRLEARGVDFEFEGEMTVDVALNAQAQAVP